jgi:ketosteroid isomerase-like protein
VWRCDTLVVEEVAGMRFVVILLAVGVAAAQNPRTLPLPHDRAVLNRDLSDGAGLARGTPKAGEQIERAEQAWASAARGSDFDRLEQILAADLIYSHSSGLVESKAQYLESLRSGRQKYDSIEFHEMEIRVRGKTAMVAGKVRMTGNTQGEPFDNMLRFLHVWVKAKRGWQLAGHQTARLSN